MLEVVALARQWQRLRICDGRIAIILALVVVEVGIGGVSVICALVVAGSLFSH